MNARAKLAVRNRDQNPSHHIWDNNGTFWIAFTVHLPDYSKCRIRVSLHTKSRGEARERRGLMLRELQRHLDLNGTPGPAEVKSFLKAVFTDRSGSSVRAQAVVPDGNTRLVQPSKLLCLSNCSPINPSAGAPADITPPTKV